MAPYSLKFQASSHNDSVNVLKFSPDGRFLASGGDDGRLLVCNVQTGHEIRKISSTSPITALTWSNDPIPQLYAGFGDGRLLVVQLTTGLIDGHYLPRESGDGIIEDINHDERSRYLYVCAGATVEVWRELQPRVMARTRLPRPRISSFPSIPLSARSVHIIEGGNALMVTFLDHGIHRWDMIQHAFTWMIRPRTPRIGRSAISPDEHDQSHIRTFSADTSINVSLPILFIDRGSALLMGSSCGKVKICDTSTGKELQELYHDDEIIQTIAWWGADGHQPILATAPSEKGAATVVSIWQGCILPHDGIDGLSEEVARPHGVALVMGNLPFAIIGFGARRSVIVAGLGCIGLALVSYNVLHMSPSGPRLLSGADIMVRNVGAKAGRMARLWLHIAGAAVDFTVSIARKLIQMCTRYIVYVQGDL